MDVFQILTKTYRIALLVGLCAATLSCVLPTRPLDKVLIAEEKVTAIRPGHTDRTAVAKLLGAPDMKTQDNTRWVYETRISNPTKVKGCTDSGCQQFGNTTTDLLDITFAPDGKALSVETTSAENDGCTASGICIWPECNRKMALYAFPDSSARNAGQESPEMCTVYAFVTPGPRPCWAVQLGADPPRQWVMAGEYVRKVLEPGKQKIWTISKSDWNDSVWHDLSEDERASRGSSVTIDCGSSDIHFLEIRYVRESWARFKTELVEVDRARGQKEIADKKELLASTSWTMWLEQLGKKKLLTEGSY